MSVNNLIIEKMAEQRNRNRKFTKEYVSLSANEKEDLKLELNKSPCNIWGYMIELEERIKRLEEVTKQ